jgi:uncharacterized protein YhfF
MPCNSHAILTGRLATPGLLSPLLIEATNILTRSHAGGNMPPKTEQIKAFWKAYRENSGARDRNYDVVAFGDSPTMASELAALVVVDTKRATASLLRDYSDDGKPVPKVGDLVVVVDGEGDPKCIWRTTEIEIKPLIAVDDRFAWDEGEGDRSREWWLNAHRGYFARQATRDGFQMHDDIDAVFERFEIVWPLSLAHLDNVAKS